MGVMDTEWQNLQTTESIIQVQMRTQRTWIKNTDLSHREKMDWEGQEPSVWCVIP